MSNLADLFPRAWCTIAYVVHFPCRAQLQCGKTDSREIHNVDQVHVLPRGSDQSLLDPIKGIASRSVNARDAQDYCFLLDTQEFFTLHARLTHVYRRRFVGPRWWVGQFTTDVIGGCAA